MTLKTGEMAVESSALNKNARINYILKYSKIENSYFKL